MNQTAIEIKNQRQYTIEAMYSNSIMFEYEIHTFFELKYFSESQNKFCISNNSENKTISKMQPTQKVNKFFSIPSFSRGNIFLLLISGIY